MAVGECGLDYWKNFDEYRDETEILGRRIMTDQPTPPPPQHTPLRDKALFCGGVLWWNPGSPSRI